MMPVMTPFSVQRSICCAHSRLRHWCRASINRVLSASLCVTAVWREGAMVAMIL